MNPYNASTLKDFLNQYSSKNKNIKQQQAIPEETESLTDLQGITDISNNNQSLRGIFDQIPKEQKDFSLENIDNDFGNYSLKEKILFSETGSPDGNYSALKDIGDGAGLSGGAFQFTEKSGNLQKISKVLGLNPDSYKNRGEYKKALSTALGSDLGKKVQDQFFQKEFVAPVDAYMKRKGINDPRIRGFLIDTRINGGYLDNIETAKKNNDYSYPSYIKARSDRYNRLINQNPALYKQFEDGWNERLDRWRSLI